MTADNNSREDKQTPKTKEIILRRKFYRLRTDRDESENAIAAKPQASIVYPDVRKDSVISFKLYNSKVVQLQNKDNEYGEAKIEGMGGGSSSASSTITPTTEKILIEKFE